MSHNSFDTMAMTQEFGNDSVRMQGTPEEPLFCVKDVCACLGISDHSKKIALLAADEKLHLLEGGPGQQRQKLPSKVWSPGPDDEKRFSLQRTPSGQRRTMIFCTEPGLYKILVSATRSPKAKVFLRWVTHDVLPSIRKTGSYSVAPPAVTEYDLRKLALEERKMTLAELNTFVSMRGIGDDIMRLAIDTRITNMVSVASSSAVTVRAPVLKPLRQVLEAHGYSFKEAAILTRRICTSVKHAYTVVHDTDPPTAKTHVNGGVYDVCQYTNDDWPIIQGVLDKLAK